MAPAMPKARPLAQISRTDRDNTVSTIIVFYSQIVLLTRVVTFFICGATPPVDYVCLT
jgi:hypothetical protein